MRAKEKALTYIEAADIYFGGVLKLNAMLLPFTCKCGGTTYPLEEKDGFVNCPIMSVPEIFLHIRRIHKERIKKDIE